VPEGLIDRDLFCVNGTIVRAARAVARAPLEGDRQG
jgi:hypothetical protein